MAGQVGSVVAGEMVSTAASFLANKFEKLIEFEVSDKVERLEWKVLKIQSAVEESMKYDITKNEALHKMQQKLMDVAQEGEKVLQEFNKNQVSVPGDIQNLNQAVTTPNSSIVRSSNSGELHQPINFHLVMNSLLCNISIIRPISQYVKNMLIKMKEREKLNRILVRIEVISEDIGDFLSMSREHRRKRRRDKRWRYRPYLDFFKFFCFELAQDAVGYCGAQISWYRMRSLIPETATLVETKGEFGLKAAGGASISQVPKMLFCVLN